MEDTLRELQQAMAAHRKALAAAPAAAVGATAAQPEPIDGHASVMRRLARDIERIAGIAITDIIEAKLARVLASVPTAEFAAWAGRLSYLPADHPEWLSLIESLTVHETFFHRDRSQLDLLARVLTGTISQSVAEERHSLRLWSAGCATGEEAYTLAILALRALRDAGFAEDTPDGGIACHPPWQLEVLGTDISRLVLVQAKSAVYSAEGLSAFRDLPRELRRFFPVLAGTGPGGENGLRGVLPVVKRHVRFRQFNLVAASPPDTGFDVVLCRNVLIYLTAEARSGAQALFKQALRAGGYLLLGPTDSLVEPPAYEPCWAEGAVAYRLKPQR